MKKLLPFALILFLNNLFAQTVLENNPASLKWRQINTPHFRILFPQGFEDQGQRVASTLEKIRVEESLTMGKPPRKISIILQNQSSVSNGFVSMLPRRSEFYGMPSQNYNFVGTNDWLNLLMSHEYRHIVQYQHATRGFNKVFYYLFGNATLAGMAQVAAPEWLWEGDAVVTETAFTRSGRGKIPNFGLLFRTNILEGREFNYHKQYLRSYKHNIPNEYPLGFYMVSYLRKRTNDPDIWEKITARSWSVPFIPFAFSNAIKKESGLYVTQLYREMAKDLKQQWQAKLKTLELTPFDKIQTKRRKGYTDYLYPQAMDDGSVIALKRGIGDIERFVRLKDGKEKKIYVPGFMNDPGMLSAAGSKIVWNEFGYNPRWLVKNYSLVKTYDVQTKKRRIVGTNKDRFGSAALAPDGSKVVTIRTTTNYQTQIVVMDYLSGKILKEFPNPENMFYSMPRWSTDGKSIVVLKTNSDGRAISQLDYESGNLKDILPISQENVGHPVPFNDYVFFNSPVSGIDNIYVVNVLSGERYQVTSSRYGAYNPSIAKDGKTIFYNDQSKDGFDIVKIPFDPTTWSRFESRQMEPEFYKHLVEQEGNPNLLSGVSDQKLAVTKYSKLKGIINPYSWGLNVQTDLTQATVGITSKDILSTTSIDLGYVFDINERTGAYKAQVSYQGWFPIIDVSASYSNRSVDEGDVTYGRIVTTSTGKKDTVSFTSDLTFTWQERTAEAGLRIPLVLTNSRFASNLSFGDYVGYTSVTDFKNSIDGGGRLLPTEYPQRFYRNYLDHGNLIYNHFTLTAYRFLKTSRRDINSKWGQQLTVHSYSTPFGGDYSGNQFSIYGVGYFPGFFRHHSIWGYWGYQGTRIDKAIVSTGEGLNNYTFRNRIPLPRGQSTARFQQFYTMSLNYTMPVWYPDVAIGPLLNIQRLRTNVFVDYGFGQNPDFKSSASYTSVGVEGKLDINIMRFLPQFDIGVRYSKGISPATSKFEVLIGTFNF